jgi:hypothetical protein
MIAGELYWEFCAEERMTREHPPEPLDFFIWTVEVYSINHSFFISLS